MSDEHIDKLLGSESDDKELASEIKEYEEKSAASADEPAEEPAEQPEEPELEASDEVDDDTDAEPEPEPEQPQPEPQKQVDLKALQAVRAENQQLKQQMNQLSLYMQQLQQNITPQQQEEPIPDPDENPIEALSWLMKQQATQAQQQQQEAAQRQQYQYVEQIKQNYATQAHQFEAQAPDFRDAYNHLIQNRAQELSIAGLSSEQIDAQIKQEELQLAAQSLQAGVNPAQRLYEMAKTRGYRPRAAQPKQTAQDRQDMDEARKAAAINTNRSAPPAKGMTLEQIADLDGAAFDKALAKWERENGLAHKTII